MTIGGARRGWLSLLVLQAGFAVAARGGLTWTVTDRVLSVEAGAASAQTTFRYHNSGPGPVEIRSVAVSCDCVTVEAKDLTVAGGASGVLPVRIALDPREAGPIRRTITLAYDSGPPQVLTLQVNIPSLVQSSPEAIHWAMGSPATEQVFRLTTAEGVLLADPVTAARWLRLRLVRNPGGYELRIVPLSMDTMVTAAITLPVSLFGRPALPITLYAGIFPESPPPVQHPVLSNP